MPAWLVILIGVGLPAMLILGIIVSEILVQRQFKHRLDGIEKEPRSDCRGTETP